MERAKTSNALNAHANRAINAISAWLKMDYRSAPAVILSLLVRLVWTVHARPVIKMENVPITRI